MSDLLIRCYACNQHKPALDFGTDRSKPGRHFCGSRCKVCDNERKRLRAKLHPGRERAYEAKKDPKRVRASSRLRAAVKCGEVAKWPCCALPDCTLHDKKVQAHHPDYDQPLSVVWLCSTHHFQAHQESK